ncbi:MAG: IclR family transcriptional regulator [Terriglobia bacterium]
METKAKLPRRSKAPAVGVITKVLRLFDALQHNPTGMNLKQISEYAGLNKSTAYRFLAHLEREGYLVRDERGIYMLGMRLFDLASVSNHQSILRRVAQPVLRNLLSATGETVNLGVLNGSTVVYVDVLESPHEFRLVSRVGMHRPFYGTALGKAFAAFLPAERQEELLKNIQLQASTPHTLTTIAQLRKELARIRERRFAVDNEETFLGARCIAAPILNSAGEAEAAISVSGPTSRITQEEIPVIAAALREAVQAISTRLGYSSSATPGPVKAKAESGE